MKDSLHTLILTAQNERHVLEARARLVMCTEMLLADGV